MRLDEIEVGQRVRFTLGAGVRRFGTVYGIARMTGRVWVEYRSGFLRGYVRQQFAPERLVDAKEED